MFSDLRQTINVYVEEIRNKTTNKDGNILALTWAECSTYLYFLEIIYQRYKSDCESYLSINEKLRGVYATHKSDTWEPDENEQQFMASSIDFATKSRLDIESFLIFTAVLLNKLTNFPKRYFQHTTLRTVACGSHHKFWKTIQISEKLIVQPSKDILDNVEWMQNNVVNFRDDLIVHTLKTDQIERQLIRGLAFHPEKGGSIMICVLYPDVEKGQPEQHQSVELQQVVNKLEEFIPQVIEFFRSNSEVSILGLENKK